MSYSKDSVPMFDALTNGIDEILLARLEENRIEIPVHSISELMQLRQKFYVRAKKIRLQAEKTGTYGKLYTAASTFTATPDRDNLILIINSRDGIVGTSSINSVLARLKKGENPNTYQEQGSKLIEEMKETIVEEKRETVSNPFYDRNSD